MKSCLAKFSGLIDFSDLKLLTLWTLLVMPVCLVSAEAIERKSWAKTNLFDSQKKIFQASRMREELPLFYLFHQWEEKTFVQEQKQRVLGPRNLVEKMQRLQDNHDEFAVIFRMTLNYEREKKERMLLALRRGDKEEMSKLVRLDIRDYQEIWRLALGSASTGKLKEKKLNDTFNPSQHHNLALFLKHGQEQELQKTFGEFSALLEKLPESEVTLEKIKAQEELFAEVYFQQTMKEWKNKNAWKKKLNYERWQLAIVNRALDIDKMRKKDFAKFLDFTLVEGLSPYMSWVAMVLGDLYPAAKASAADHHSTLDLTLQTSGHENVAENGNDQIDNHNINNGVHHIVNNNEEQNINNEKAFSCALKDKTATAFEVRTKSLNNLTAKFKLIVEQTLKKVNSVAQSEEFLAEVKKKTYWGVTPLTVVKYLQAGRYAVRLGGKAMMSRVNASAGICSDFIYLNSNKQYRKGASLANTIFHEITHNLGFGHSTKVPYPLGDLLMKHYLKMFPEGRAEEGKKIWDQSDESDDEDFPENYIFEGNFPA